MTLGQKLALRLHDVLAAPKPRAYLEIKHFRQGDTSDDVLFRGSDLAIRLRHGCPIDDVNMVPDMDGLQPVRMNGLHRDRFGKAGLPFGLFVSAHGNAPSRRNAAPLEHQTAAALSFAKTAYQARQIVVGGRTNSQLGRSNNVNSVSGGRPCREMGLDRPSSCCRGFMALILRGESGLSVTLARPGSIPNSRSAVGVLAARGRQSVPPHGWLHDPDRVLFSHPICFLSIPFAQLPKQEQLSTKGIADAKKSFAGASRD